MNRLGFWLGLALAGAMMTPAVGCIGAPFDIGSAGGHGGVSSASASSGSGTCSAPSIQCADGCFDPSSDKFHCSDCTTKCKGVHECINGSCVCPAQYTDCGGMCTDTNVDPTHCGNCNTACTGGTTCEAGQCKCGGATPDYCSGSGKCVDLQSDATNCGTCGKVCNGTACINGQCQPCPSGQTLCAGKCRDTNVDADNCGTCGKSCPADAVCTAGACACAIPTCGATVCPGLGNPNACGTSCNGCNHPEACYGSTCKCRPELNACGGATCLDLVNDPQNCGDCSVVCDPGKLCIDGQCQTASNCAEKAAQDCGGRCVTDQQMATDPLNCGGCGNVCAPNEICFKSACHTYFPVPSCTSAVPSTCGTAHKCCPYTINNQNIGVCVAGDVCPGG